MSVIQGYPSNLIGNTPKGSFNRSASDATESESKEFTGDLKEVFITPQSGNRLIIKGVTIIGDGNSGTIKLVSGDRIILPLYLSNFSRSGTSGALNIELETDQSISILAEGRGTSISFAGVSYLEVGEAFGDWHDLFLTE